MFPPSSGNATFWRACCLVLALIAASETLGLVLVSRPSPASSPTVSSGPVWTLPATAPHAVVANPDVTEEETAPAPISPSSRVRALTTQNPRHRARAWEDLGIALAEKNPGAALRALAEPAPGADRNAMTRGVFEVLARGDAARAIAAAKQTSPGLEREAALTTLLEGWNGPGNDNSPAWRAYRIASSGLEAGLGMELLQGDSPRPDLAVLWAQELAPYKGKTELLGAAAVQAKTDPLLAASYGSGLVGKDQLAFNDQLVSSWSQTQPEAAWQWSRALDDPAARIQAQSTTIKAQSQSDPQGAIARLTLLPDDGQPWTDTLKAVAANYANQNTDAALAWAQTLPPAEKSVANEAINVAAPVGVGIMASPDDEGYAVISGLVPNMGADQSGAIHPGDRIVAVT